MFGRELKINLLELTRANTFWMKVSEYTREAPLNPVLRGDLVLLKNTKTSGKLGSNFESVSYTAQFKTGSKGWR